MANNIQNHTKQAHNGFIDKYRYLSRKLWHQFVDYEPAILVAIILIAGGIWGFIEIADGVLEGSTHAIDERIILALRDPADLSNPTGPSWVEEAIRDFTAMGGVGVLVFMTLGVAGFLFLNDKSRMAWLILVTVAGGTALSLLLKLGFDRPRPDLVSHGSYVATASFPSGHSMLSAVAYLTLGVLLARLQSEKRLKAYIMVLVVLLTGLVGFSRVYLGVHWPTDVLAGWTAGAAWAALCWVVARWLQQRGHVEAETSDS